MWKDKSRQFTFDLSPNYIYFNSLKLDTEKSQIIRPKFFTFFVYNFFCIVLYDKFGDFVKCFTHDFNFRKENIVILSDIVILIK